MEMSAFVYSGEYSTSCICSPRNAASARTDGASAADVAVIMMMRVQQQQTQQASMRASFH